MKEKERDVERQTERERDEERIKRMRRRREIAALLGRSSESPWRSIRARPWPNLCILCLIHL